LDRCLVVGSEETDWLLCDAYARWRLLREAPPIEPFSRPARGTILSEGAGALLLSRTGAEAIQKIEAGCNFENRRGATECVDRILAHLGASSDDVIIASANGTFIDAVEEMAVRRQCPAASVYAPKASLGESVGASALWQVICAVQALRTGQLPTPSTTAAVPFRRAIVSTCGLNQQVAGLSVVRADQ
jgi:3-oxoacyl-(acyl-carrier-protein) synthase